MSKSFDEDKQYVKGIIQKHNNESRRAYVVSTVLFIGILMLGALYLVKKWS